MKAKKQGNSYFITVDLGEELIGSLLSLIAQEKLEAAEIQGIGAVRNFELGYYRLAKKQYLRRSFREIVELLGCSGNVAMRGGKPFVHLHAALGRKNFSVIGGHLFRAEVAVTAEIVLRSLPRRMERRYDEKTGLFLLDLPLCKAL